MYHTSSSAATIGERLLIEDHASPVGYKVPSLPDFEIDPTIANTGLPCMTMSTEFIIGIAMALSCRYCHHRIGVYELG